MDIEKIKEAFKGKGYEVSYFSNSADALEYLDREIDGKSVGIGGSKTIEGMGLYEALSVHNDVYWHWKMPENMSKREVFQKAAFADIYLSSANGASEDGCLVNIDGNGNRLGATLFGHEKVYFVIGTNKIASTLEEAITRARQVASPMNAKRFNIKTPCMKDGKCHDCNSLDRICNALMVHYRKMNEQAAEIVIIDESLGY